jgi:hypothetical protein
MAKVGRPRDLDKLGRILAALSADPSVFFEIGTPPYNVALLSATLGMDASNLRKDLLHLESEGLVIREYRKVASWNAIAGDTMQRTCLCFWNVATLQKNRAEIDVWNVENEAERASPRDVIGDIFGKK